MPDHQQNPVTTTARPKTHAHLDTTWTLDELKGSEVSLVRSRCQEKLMAFVMHSGTMFCIPQEVGGTLIGEDGFMVMERNKWNGIPFFPDTLPSAPFQILL